MYTFSPAITSLKHTMMHLDLVLVSANTSFVIEDGTVQQLTTLQSLVLFSLYVSRIQSLVRTS